MTPPHDPLEELRVELAALRLLSRAVATFVICNNVRPAEETLCELSSMLAGTGPYAVPVKDMDQALYERAQALARLRVGDFVSDLSRHRLAPTGGGAHGSAGGLRRAGGFGSAS
jgi:hypothetical protein